MRDVIMSLAVVLVAAFPARGAQNLDAQRNGMPRAGSGQTSHNVTRPVPPPPPAPPPTAPRVVAPPLTYPFPPLMTPPAGGLLPRAGEGVPFRTGSRRDPYRSSGGSAFYGPLYGYATGDSVDPNRQRPAPPAPSSGLLRLDVTPTTAQLFIDSLYVGTVADINARNVLQLEEGPHRIEIRAPQYQTVTVDVRILPYETVTYRAALEPARAAAPVAVPPPAASAAAAKMYMIPNCYLGNIPPRANRLPSGCDIKQVQVLGPK
jgi:hypothetical protein